MKNRFTNLLLIAVGVYLAFCLAGPLAAFYTLLVLSALLIRPSLAQRSYALDTTAAAALQLNTALDIALQAYKRAILPLTVFATVFRNVVLKGKTAKVEVPYYPLVTSASRDLDTSADDCYNFDDAYAVATREVAIDHRKYQPISIKSDEWNRLRNIVDYERIFAAAGEKLAYDVIQDVMSVITAANFGAAAFTGADTTFDSDDVADLIAVADTIPWPLVGRGLVVKPLYKANLFKDNDVKLEYALGDDSVIKEGRLPRLMGFDFGSTPAIPANGENLVGFMAHMSAVLVAFSPVEPAPGVRAQLTNYEVVTDESGVSLEYRSWGDPDCDEERHVIEANYGFAKGNEDGLRRFVSA